MVERLWKKKSKSADAPFVNLFANRNFGTDSWDSKLKSADWKNSFLLIEVTPGKNNRTSDRFRALGNDFFRDEEFTMAMEMYSQSLCFAELNTDNVSFATANRAASFLSLKKYDQCLRDIELATRANYPNMPKLMERKAKCERLMQSATEDSKFDLKLSFNPNEKFPCMADVLEIQKNDEFGRHVVANRDIDVGQTILIEKCFMTSGCASDRVQCYTCIKEEENFIACPNCTDVMFCNEECRLLNKVHQKFCGATINRMPKEVKTLARSVMIGLTLFSTADDMMNFVKNVLAIRKTVIPDAANDPLSEYGLFLSLKSNQSSFDMELFYKVFTGLLDFPPVRDMFNTIRSRRFLKHLIAEHWTILRNNAFNLSVEGGYVALILGAVTSLFNHSCAANALNTLSGTVVLITTRPIKEGEQVFIEYGQDGLLSFLWDFTCKCDKCRPHCKKSDRLKMLTDSDYQALSTISLEKSQNLTIEAQIGEKCVVFLNRYGHLPWTKEMDHVLKIYKEWLFQSVRIE